MECTGMKQHKWTHCGTSISRFHWSAEQENKESYYLPSHCAHMCLCEMAVKRKLAGETAEGCISPCLSSLTAKQSISLMCPFYVLSFCHSVFLSIFLAQHTVEQKKSLNLVTCRWRKPKADQTSSRTERNGPTWAQKEPITGRSEPF